MKIMKIIVKLAVLFAALLLLTSVAFAEDCNCYAVTQTPLEDPSPFPSDTFPVTICFDDGDNVGTIAYLCSDVEDPLVMFFNSMSDQAVTSHEYDIDSLCVAYLKFHGDNNYALTGMRYNTPLGRASLKGHKIDWCLCNPC
jgi:hypothetical protein